MTVKNMQTEAKTKTATTTPPSPHATPPTKPKQLACRRRQLTFHNKLGIPGGRLPYSVISDALKGTRVLSDQLVHRQVRLGPFASLLCFGAHVVAGASPRHHVWCDGVGIGHALKERRPPFILQHSTGDVDDAGGIWKYRQVNIQMIFCCCVCSLHDTCDYKYDTYSGLGDTVLIFFIIRIPAWNWFEIVMILHPGPKFLALFSGWVGRRGMCAGRGGLVVVVGMGE